MKLTITVNGESKEVATTASVADLIEQLELNPRQVAVEVNLKLVPRAEHAQHQLADGDQLEIVTLAGGG